MPTSLRSVRTQNKFAGDEPPATMYACQCLQSARSRHDRLADQVRRQNTLNDMTDACGWFPGAPRCARCHDHKFEAIPRPITTNAAFFESAQFRNDVVIAPQKSGYAKAQANFEQQMQPVRALTSASHTVVA